MRTAMFIIISFVIHSLLLFCLFHSGIAGTVAFFYRGLAFIVCVGLLQGIALGVLRKRLMIPRLVIISLTSIFISVHVVFFTVVPVTLDRSVSVFLLQRMQSNGSVYTKKQLEDVLIDGFILKSDAVGKRIIEQEQTGSIRPDGGGWRITPRGEWIVNMYRIVGALFGIQTSGR